VKKHRTHRFTSLSNLLVKGWMAGKNVLREVKHQIPSAKLQISSNNQNLKFQNNPFGHLKLELRIYLGFGICHLEFAIPNPQS